MMHEGQSSDVHRRRHYIQMLFVSPNTASSMVTLSVFPLLRRSTHQQHLKYYLREISISQVQQLQSRLYLTISVPYFIPLCYFWDVADALI
ncbi:Minor cardiolipin synthase ClsB [Labeo rohita]|uniref:Minor cardiolipin synthase ClsB n=1 Tax=Labeo rohita TaxID=84645 RepID=A0ABQ8LIP6_LABRO|nr:Minor cardiolipin synthase ClsB [Labeo rohita]